MENLICNQEVTLKINNDLRLQWLFCNVLWIKVYVTLTPVTKYENRDQNVCGLVAEYSYVSFWNTKTDHLIPGLIFFFREAIICSEVATRQERWYLHNRKPVSPHIRSVEASQWTSACSVHRILRWRRKFNSLRASIYVSIWGKLVLKCTKCCKQLLESPTQVNRRHLSGIPVSKVDVDPLMMTPAQAGRLPPTLRRLWHVCKKSFALTDVLLWERLQRMLE